MVIKTKEDELLSLGIQILYKNETVKNSFVLSIRKNGDTLNKLKRNLYQQKTLYLTQGR